MNINPVIIAALEPLGLPVRQSVFVPAPPYNEPPEQYFVFQTYRDALSDFASSCSIREDLRGQAVLYSKGDYKALAEQAVAALRNAGFKAQLSVESYEKETGYFSQIIEWQWYERLWSDGL